MKKRLLLSLLCLAALTLTGCTEDNDDTAEGRFEESDLVGKGLLDNTQEYWRYDSGHYGETWDESDSVLEGEGIRFSWELKDANLEVLFTGEMGQVVPYDYTVLALTSTAMRLRDEYNNEKTYYKI